MDDQERESIVMREIESRPGIGKTELVRRVRDDMSRKTAYRILDGLVEGGEVVRCKVGRTARHHLRDARERELKENLKGALGDYIEDLRSIERELPDYPYEVSVALGRVVTEQKSRMATSKRFILDGYEYDHYVEDFIAYYRETRDEITKSLDDSPVREDIKRDVRKTLRRIFIYISIAVEHRCKAEKERAALGGRDKSPGPLVEKIKRLDGIRDELHSHMKRMLQALEDGPPARESTMPSWDTRHLTSYLHRLEQFREVFREKVGEELALARGELDGGSGQAPDRTNVLGKELETLDGIKEKIDGIKEKVDETEGLLDRLHSNLATDGMERNLLERATDAKKYLDIIEGYYQKVGK